MDAIYDDTNGDVSMLDLADTTPVGCAQPNLKRKDCDRYLDEEEEEATNYDKENELEHPNDEDIEDDDYDDEEEEEEEFGRVAFSYDVSQLSNNQNGNPQNGHDYLRAVELERKQYSAICYAKPPVSSNVKAQTEDSMISSSAEEQQQLNSKVSSMIGDLKFRDQILNNFRTFKQAIEEARNSDISEQPTQIRYLLKMTQLETHLTLEDIANRFEVATKEADFDAEWVYNLIAALREPVEPDITSTLRRLAKICLSRWAIFEEANSNDLDGQANGDNNNASEQKDEKQIACLLIVCIVRHHYGQIDIK